MQNDDHKPVVWQPKTIEPPHITPSFEKLNLIERSAEVLRYSILRLEYWVSPTGRLREWIRLNIFAGIFIGIPALILVPILTYLLGQFATWMGFLAEAARNLLFFTGYLLLTAALVSAAVMFVRAMGRRK